MADDFEARLKVWLPAHVFFVWSISVVARVGFEPTTLGVGPTLHAPFTAGSAAVAALNSRALEFQ